MTDIKQQERVEVFVEVDAGKGADHAVALDLTGERPIDSALPKTRPDCVQLITKLKEHSRALLVVDLISDCNTAFTTDFRSGLRVTAATGVPVACVTRPGIGLTSLRVQRMATSQDLVIVTRIVRISLMPVIDFA